MANKEFETYRAKELGGVQLGDGPDDDDFYRLKVTGKSRDTKWLNITPAELERIIEALEPEDYRNMVGKLHQAFRRGEDIPDLP